MRNLAKTLTCTIATAGVAALGLTATAQAQSTSAVLLHDPSVPVGVETAITLPKCPGGTTVSSVTPAPPAAVNVVRNGASTRLAGDWLTSGSTTFTVHCSNSTTKTATVSATATAPENSAVGVGSDTLQNVFDQFSGDYNAGLSATASHLYSWDATNPTTGMTGDPITEKAGCGPLARPYGSNAGINVFATFAPTSDQKFYCTSFARFAQLPPCPPDTQCPPGAMHAYMILPIGADDVITWAAQATANAPASLTQTQLAAIYNCAITNWDQVGGLNAPIHAFIPQSGSDTRSSFLSAIGVASPGSCVSDDGGHLQPNEGVNSVLNDPDAIVPYSISAYIAENFHSASCINTSCTPNSSGVVCRPAKAQNLFGCNTHGTMVLKQINGVAPTTGSGTSTVANSAFPSVFQRPLYHVVPYDPNSGDHIPGGEPGAPGGINLEPVFSVLGFVCASTKALTDLHNYGFLHIGGCI
jgi:ABC-type phosphate transport system substrate-binding protein